MKVQAPGRDVFRAVLQSVLELTPNQANRYAWTVLYENSEESADRVRKNGHKVVGEWRCGDMTGSAGNLLVTKTESLRFADDLTYQYKVSRYEG
jgi:hypothetical protein